MWCVDRELLQGTFESAANNYNAARPDYPSEQYDDLIEIIGLAPPANLIEVGWGPGQATGPIVSRGSNISALELGPARADLARSNLKPFTNTQIVHIGFEEWTPPKGRAPDLVYAARAWPGSIQP